MNYELTKYTSEDLKNNVEDHYILAIFDITERLVNKPNEHRLTLELTLHYK